MQKLFRITKKWNNKFYQFQSPLRQFSNSEEESQDSHGCVMLHPVTWPNRGPQVELYHAEEAIGLVRSLDWDVIKGPLWQEEEQRDQQDKNNTSDDEGLSDNDSQNRELYQDRVKKLTFNPKENYRQFKKEKITDGDYVYAPNIQGVYHKGGIIWEYEEQEDTDIYDEWKNELLRESTAKGSLIKVRKIHSATFFTKGKLNEIGHFLKDNIDIDIVFINAQLTSLQQRNLEKRWNDIILDREERLRKYYLRSAQKDSFEPTDIDSDTQLSEIENQQIQEQQPQRKIKIIDRFGIILQIFALRAKTRIAQLQIELAWMNYARTMLVRGGAPTFGQIGHIFDGDLMKQEVQQVEIKSAKGRRSSSGTGGFIGGGGETQLELERRKLGERESKIHKEMESLNKKNQHDRNKKIKEHSTLPLIALIGYTNAGKTALTNLCTGANLESEDLLFQTLNTSQRRFRLPNGQMSVMLDTVGFITNLPHALVGSFKATLEEIHYADLIVHVRDISHPLTNYQRDTVIKVLKEIGVPQDIYNSKYIEVWNKIDLLDDKDNILEQLNSQEQIYPIVPMSCTKGTNKEQFLDEVTNLSKELMGKKYYKLTYPYYEHDKRQKWLLQAANITEVSDIEYDYQNSSMTINVLLDEIVYQKYLKEFEEDQFIKQKQQSKRTKLQPPPGWDA